jgi:4-carboxymuconolactone decarboxylase
MANIPNRPEYQSDLFKKGLDVRRDILGAEYVDGSLTRADDFNAAFQQMTTEVAWGMIWTRPGLPRKTRSMINLTMLAALNRGAEFRLHLRAALTNGVTRDEIKEILLQIGAYCGIPYRHRGLQGGRQHEGQRLMPDRPNAGVRAIRRPMAPVSCAPATACHSGTTCGSE